jgi:hypothetical protein
MLVLTRAIQPNIPEDAILHSHHRENLISYMVQLDLKTSLLSGMKPVNSFIIILQKSWTIQVHNKIFQIS